jgi:MFS family permease
MTAGVAVMLAASACYPLVRTVGPSLFCIRVVHGLGFSAFVAGSFSAVALLIPGGRRAEAYSMVGASLMAAAALAPLVGEILLKGPGFWALLAAACGAALLSCGAILAAGGLGRVGGRHERVAPGGRYGPLLRDGSFVSLLISTFIFAHCQSTVFNFLALEAESKGASAGTFFFAAFSLAIALLLTMGRVIDRKGKIRFLRTAYPPFALGLVLLPLLFGPSGGWVPALLFGAGMGLLFPAHNALAAEHGGPGEKASVMALFTAVYDSGFITGAVASGSVAARLGLDHMFFATGALAAVGFLVCLAAPIREES